MSCEQPEYIIEFYESPEGDKPVLRWIREELSVSRRRALGYALFRVLQRLGVGVCGTEFGRHLGGGLFEFRLRTVPAGEREAMTLRIFCHATGRRVIVLLGAYDKGRDPSPRRQSSEIAVARRRLVDFLDKETRNTGERRRER